MLSAPDYSLRLAVIEQKAKECILDITEEAAKYIAHNLSGNIRELEGAVVSLSAYESLDNMPADIDLTRKVLRNIISTATKEVTLEDIHRVVAAYFDIPPDILRQKTRVREVVQARQVIMHLAKLFTKLTLKSIGEYFGGRDHTTVIHATQTVHRNNSQRYFRNY